MIVFPHCKINLGLHILEKRADGFHNLETVFYPIPLCDALELVEAPLDQTAPVKIGIEGLAVKGDLQHNLIYKAYQLIAQDYALKPATFYLLKNIPMGAGLGGGSSDGAFAIALLNQYFELHIPFEKQLHYAAQLGSDCAYFLYHEACFAAGRGEILTPIPFSLKDYWIVLVKPAICAGILPCSLEHSKNPLRTPILCWSINNPFRFSRTGCVSASNIILGHSFLSLSCI